MKLTSGPYKLDFSDHHVRWGLLLGDPDADGKMVWECHGPGIVYAGEVWPDPSGQIWGEQRWFVAMEGQEGDSSWRQVAPDVAVLKVVSETEWLRQKGRNGR